MKRIISFLFAMSSIMSFAQQLDGYKKHYFIDSMYTSLSNKI